ncbi:sulfotransferase domain-containing protein [uncultured Sulfitobacter sp.]|uniref:sulfotransferase domain-containing protein n=1 Tax=uncultured Sulfitobacter sp. TaxID=191468 RepID=UPI002618AB34|nr:sulfotransferase domain-containing protein [uncultured Sulfitobacter sp.]
MTRHLIIPGLAKAGTTFLHDNLIRNGAAFNKPKVKELNFFSRRAAPPYEKYCNLFPDSAPDRYFLDCSPIYLETRNPVGEHISQCLKGHDVRFIVTLRNPVDTVISHYYHDLKSNIARFRRLPEHTSFSFWDPKVVAKYFISRFARVKRLKQMGYSVLGVHQNDLFEPDAAQKIGAFLEIDLQPFRTGKVSNPGGWLPYFVYGGKNGASTPFKGALYKVPPRALILVSNSRSEILFNAGAELAQHAFALQASFTRRITVARSFSTPPLTNTMRCAKHLASRQKISIFVEQ